jgi:uncharacterized protein (TIGR03086 family)
MRRDHLTLPGQMQWAARVAAVKNDQWLDPTPCTEWSVRELVNHVIAEELWTAPLLRGATVQEVGSQFDGDLLGEDPSARTRIAADEAVAIVDVIVPGGGRVQLSYGEEDMEEYVRQLCADHLIHGWDLAAATGGDTSLDPELVAEVGAWFVEHEEMYRGAFWPEFPVGSQPCSAGPFFGGFRLRRRRRDHGADDRRLRLRVDRPVTRWTTQ